MYISRVEIDDKNRQKLKELQSLGSYHNWVERSFPDEKKSEFRHLWRIDRLQNKRYLLIVSPNKPDMVQLEKYGVRGTAQISNYDHYLNSLKENQILRFRLTANPVSRHNGKVIKASMPADKKQGKNMLDRQKDWLLKRTAGKGFKIVKNDLGMDDFEIVSRKLLRLKHRNDQAVNLKQVTYEGILQITDLEKFKETLVKGLGRERAYGMGLITVIPIK